jgi:hypothetical protein
VSEEERLLREAYDAFNARDLDGALEEPQRETK